MGSFRYNITIGPFSNVSNAINTANNGQLDYEQLLFENLGERRKDTLSVVFLIGVYCIIFVTGVVGNLSTCVVIWRNTYMHTVTNYYLFNLAVSDLLTLIFGKYILDNKSPPL